jgi:glycerol-3-phosphate dehydrogenase
MNSNIKESIQNNFSREDYINQIKNNREDFDLIIIGGGATGLGVALDAASRGYKILLLEQADFAKGTSSRSTKLIHGGVRYLAQGNISLVYEALYERGLLLKNAPHLVSMQPFIIPTFTWWSQLVYGVGLKIYDWMAWRYRFPKTSLLRDEAVTKLIPNLKRSHRKGGVLYYDGQFDDSRLAVNLAQTCAEQGGILINYMKVESLTKDANGKVCGVKAKDLETGNDYVLKSRAVINATGVFVDNILQMNAPSGKPMVRPSQGVHIVLDHSFLQGKNALMIPATSDGRVLFAVPWHNHVLVGTTDTPLDKHSLEPVPLEDEIDFVLETLGQYLIKKPTEKDVLSVFAGLRPLAAQNNDNGQTKEISRSHKLFTTPSGLITITGGKWTTYRKMAEDTVDEAIKVAHLKKRPCVTSSLKIHGYKMDTNSSDHLNVYGSDAQFIRTLSKEHQDLRQTLHPAFPHTHAEVIWAVRNEMARSVEDILARRLRILFLNAQAAIEMAPKVAALVAGELGFDREWQRKQVDDFTSLAGNYLLESKHHLTVL